MATPTFTLAKPTDPTLTPSAPVLLRNVCPMARCWLGTERRGTGLSGIRRNTASAGLKCTQHMCSVIVPARLGRRSPSSSSCPASWRCSRTCSSGSRKRPLPGFEHEREIRAVVLEDPQTNTLGRMILGTTQVPELGSVFPSLSRRWCFHHSRGHGSRSWSTSPQRGLAW